MLSCFTRPVGWGLTVSSFYFLWPFPLMAVLLPYGLLTSGSSGESGIIDVAYSGYRFMAFSVVPGTALLTWGICILKKDSSPRLAKRILVGGLLILAVLGAVLWAENAKMEVCVHNKRNAFLEITQGREVSEHDETSMRLGCREQNTLDAEIDRLGLAIARLQIENGELARPPVSEEARQTISQNNEDIAEMLTLLDALSPPAPTVEIPDHTRAQMNAAMDALIESGLPVYGLVPNSSTGNLDIFVESPVNIDDQIRQITGDLPIHITYGTNTFRLQAYHACAV